PRYNTQRPGPAGSDTPGPPPRQQRLEPSAMTTREPLLCPADSPLFDPEFVLTTVALVLVLALGGVIIRGAFRWYRGLKQPSSTSGDDQVQLMQALEEDELDPQELERVRAAIQKQQPKPDPGSE